jgi:hypothetical protein
MPVPRCHSRRPAGCESGSRRAQERAVALAGVDRSFSRRKAEGRVRTAEERGAAPMGPTLPIERRRRFAARPPASRSVVQASGHGHEASNWRAPPRGVPQRPQPRLCRARRSAPRPEGRAGKAIAASAAGSPAQQASDPRPGAAVPAVAGTAIARSRVLCLRTSPAPPSADGRGGSRGDVHRSHSLPARSRDLPVDLRGVLARAGSSWLRSFLGAARLPLGEGAARLRQLVLNADRAPAHRRADLRHAPSLLHPQQENGPVARR